MASLHHSSVRLFTATSRAVKLADERGNQCQANAQRPLPALACSAFPFPHSPSCPSPCSAANSSLQRLPLGVNQWAAATVPTRAAAAGASERASSRERAAIRCSASGKGRGIGGEEGLLERVMSGVVNSGGAAVLGTYVAEPVTWMHRLDPRVKQLWLLALVFLPARATPPLRLSLCAFLLLLTLTTLPRQLAKEQLIRSVLLSLLVFLGLAFATDGIPTFVQPRSLPHAIEPLGLPPPLPSSSPSLLSWPSGYHFVLLQLGPIVLTRRAARLAATAASLCFLILQSASLSLTTTNPELTAGALRWFLSPLTLSLSLLGSPLHTAMDRTVLALLLALRFMGLVFDEVRNLALGVVARGIQWKQLGIMGSIDLLVALFGRLFQNLFNHASQISQAMVARGYRGSPSRHALFFLHDFPPTPTLNDALALLLLAALCCLTLGLRLAVPT